MDYTCTPLKLETGVSRPEALGLYECAGYTRHGPYGEYRDDPLGALMQKCIAE